MSFPSSAAAARQRLHMHGVDVAIQHYEMTDGGSRGAHPEKSETDNVKAYVQDKSGSSGLAELLGQELNINITFTFLAEEISDDLRDGGHDSASTVIYRDRTYVVEHIENEGGATLTLHCSTREDD